MKLLTIREVAEILKLSENRIYTLTKQGVIPSLKISGSIRFVSEEFEKWLRGGNEK